jgi:hypothetical protein
VVSPTSLHTTSIASIPTHMTQAPLAGTYMLCNGAEAGTAAGQSPGAHKHAPLIQLPSDGWVVAQWSTITNAHDKCLVKKRACVTILRSAAGSRGQERGERECVSEGGGGSKARGLGIGTHSLTIHNFIIAPCACMLQHHKQVPCIIQVRGLPTATKTSISMKNNAALCTNSKIPDHDINVQRCLTLVAKQVAQLGTIV